MKSIIVMVVKKAHSCPKWYNFKDEAGNIIGKICRKEYLKLNYAKKGKQIQQQRKDQYHNDPEYKAKVQEANRRRDHERRAAGIKQKRKPLTEEQKIKRREAKKRWEEKNPEKVATYDKQYKAKHYEENKEYILDKGAKARLTVSNQYSQLKANGVRYHYATPITKDQYILFRTTNNSCEYCTKPLADTGTATLRKSRLLPLDITNAAPSCKTCISMNNIGKLVHSELVVAGAALQSYWLNNDIPEKVIDFPLTKYSETKPLRFAQRWDFLNRRADERNLKQLLSKDDLKDLLSQPCFYCHGDISLRGGYGIDRIDSDDGYYFENCVPCCGFCNGVKGERLTMEEALMVINAIQKSRMKCGRFYNLKMEVGLKPEEKFDEFH